MDLTIEVTNCRDCPFMYESSERNRCGDTYSEQCCILFEDHTTDTGVPFDEFWGDEFDQKRDSENSEESYKGKLVDATKPHVYCPLKNRSVHVKLASKEENQTNEKTD